MGIQVEYNPDLALRDFKEFLEGRRKKEECLPQILEVGEIYNFLKKNQRLYYLFGEIPLLKTEGNQKLSYPIASIILLEATHVLIDDEIWTRGKYKVVEVFDDEKPRFNGFAKVV